MITITQRLTPFQGSFLIFAKFSLKDENLSSVPWHSSFWELHLHFSQFMLFLLRTSFKNISCAIYYFAFSALSIFLKSLTELFYSNLAQGNQNQEYLFSNEFWVPMSQVYCCTPSSKNIRYGILIEFSKLNEMFSKIANRHLLRLKPNSDIFFWIQRY